MNTITTPVVAILLTLLSLEPTASFSPLHALPLRRTPGRPCSRYGLAAVASSRQNFVGQRGCARLHVLRASVQPGDPEVPDAQLPPWIPKSGKKPLVILVGFLGCTPGIIAKYSLMYKGLGVETIEILPSIGSMLLAHQGWRGKGSKRVKSVCNLILTRAADSEIIVHLFSNNGFIFVGACMSAEPRFSDALSAVIMDSCPSYITPQVAATGLLSALLRVEASQVGRRGGTSIRKTILAGALAPLLLVLESRQLKAWHAWSSSYPKAPHLFLYSRGDQVVSPDEIKEFAQQHAARLASDGVAVQEERWQTAEHCALLREDGIKYAHQIRTFLENIA